MKYLAVSTEQVSASGNLTLTEPSGVAEGDLLIAAIAYRDNAGFTQPSGWTLVRQQSDGNLTVNSAGSRSGIIVASIVRGASAPGLTFTRTGGDVAMGAIVALRGGTATVKAVQTSAATILAAASTTVTTNIQTADQQQSVGRGIALWFVSNARAGTTSGYARSGSATIGTPSEVLDASTTTGADVALAIAHASISANSGETITQLSATASSSARHAIAGLIVEEYSEVSGLVAQNYQVPSGSIDYGSMSWAQQPQIGDILLSCISLRGSAAFTAPSGWTTLESSTGNSTDGTTASVSGGHLAWHRYNGTMPSLVFSRTGGDLAFGAMIILRPRAGLHLDIVASASNVPGIASSVFTCGNLDASGAQYGDIVLGLICGARSGAVSTLSYTGILADGAGYDTRVAESSAADTGGSITVTMKRVGGNSDVSVSGTYTSSARHFGASAVVRPIASVRHRSTSSTSDVSAGSLTLTEPTGASEGDLLVAVISYRDSVAFSLPSGWEQVALQNVGNTVVDGVTSISSALIAKTTRGASAPSYVFSRTGGDAAIGTVVCLSPVLSGQSIQVRASDLESAPSETGNVGNVDIAAVVGDMLLSGFFAARSLIGVTAPTLGSSSYAVLAHDKFVERANASTLNGADAGIVAWTAVIHGGHSTLGPLQSDVSPLARHAFGVLSAYATTISVAGNSALFWAFP